MQFVPEVLKAIFQPFLHVESNICQILHISKGAIDFNGGGVKFGTHSKKHRKSASFVLLIILMSNQVSVTCQSSLL